MKKLLILIPFIMFCATPAKAVLTPAQQKEYNEIHIHANCCWFHDVIRWFKS